MKSLWLGAALALALTGLSVRAQKTTDTTQASDIKELERLETVWNEAPRAWRCRRLGCIVG